MLDRVSWLPFLQTELVDIVHLTHVTHDSAKWSAVHDAFLGNYREESGVFAVGFVAVENHVAWDHQLLLGLFPQLRTAVELILKLFDLVDFAKEATGERSAQGNIKLDLGRGLQEKLSERALDVGTLDLINFNVDIELLRASLLPLHSDNKISSFAHYFFGSQK